MLETFLKAAKEFRNVSSEQNVSIECPEETS